MKESRLKTYILVFMLLAKIATIALIMFHFNTRGLEKNEMISALTLILPLFTVYLTVIVKDIISNPYKEKASNDNNKRMKSSISIMTFIVFPIYFFAIVVSVNQTAQGNLSGNELQQIIGLIEGAFGIYVGQIVFALFQKEEKK